MNPFIQELETGCSETDSLNKQLFTIVRNILFLNGFRNLHCYRIVASKFTIISFDYDLYFMLREFQVEIVCNLIDFRRAECP